MKRFFDFFGGDKVTILVRERGRTKRYPLDGRQTWLLGRAVPGNTPDIPLRSEIAGRKHGEFLLMDGQLFYIDRGSVNGTSYNGKMLAKGMNGRANPVLLSDGDVLRIDCGEAKASDPRNVIIQVRIRG